MIEPRADRDDNRAGHGRRGKDDNAGDGRRTDASGYVIAALWASVTKGVGGGNDHTGNSIAGALARK